MRAQLSLYLVSSLAVVHQFRPTRQSTFVASLRRIFPPRGPSYQETDALYHTVAWQARLYDRPLQRVPFVWDDKRRMEKIAEAQRKSGLANPADSKLPLPPELPPCVTKSQRFRACAARDELGAVQGTAWEAMAQDGFVLSAPTPLLLSQPMVIG